MTTETQAPRGADPYEDALEEAAIAVEISKGQDDGEALRLAELVRGCPPTLLQAVHADLADLGVAAPSVELVRAALAHEHVKAARDLMAQLGEGRAQEPLEHAEAATGGRLDELLAATPIGASWKGAGLLDSMARDAASALAEVPRPALAGLNVMVTGPSSWSSPAGEEVRCRRETTRIENLLVRGVAVVDGVSVLNKTHSFPRPVLIGGGDGMQDPRRPFDWVELAFALAAAGLLTRDELPPRPAT